MTDGFGLTDKTNYTSFESRSDAQVGSSMEPRDTRKISGTPSTNKICEPAEGTSGGGGACTRQTCRLTSACFSVPCVTGEHMGRSKLVWLAASAWIDTHLAAAFWPWLEELGPFCARGLCRRPAGRWEARSWQTDRCTSSNAN